MKKTNFLFAFALTILFAMTFTSCEEDITPGAENDPPAISLLSGGVTTDTTFEPSTDFTVKLKAIVGTGDLKLVTVYKDAEQLDLESIKSGLDGNPALLLGADQKGFEKEITITLPSEEVATEYSFFVEDVNGLKDSVYVIITTEKTATPLNFFKNDIKVFNADAPVGYYGSIDLQTGETVSSSDENGDVQDLGLVNGEWAKRIKPENGAEMRIPAEGVDFDSMESLQELLAAYDGGTVSEEADVVEGASYIFKTKDVNGQSDFFILKNTKVYEEDNSNKDYYLFDLKGFKF